MNTTCTIISLNLNFTIANAFIYWPIIHRIVNLLSDDSLISS